MQLCATNGLRPVTLELGGKSPLVIFEDCDLDNAVKGAMLANFLTQGQVCSNAARVYVHRSILSEFTDKVVKRTLAMKIGDPFAEETTVGATISMLHMEKIQRYIESAKQEVSAKIQKKLHFFGTKFLLNFALDSDYCYGLDLNSYPN